MNVDVFLDAGSISSLLAVGGGIVDILVVSTLKLLLGQLWNI
jgi:hypothetical protein